jgi:hypothetical protein
MAVQVTNFKAWAEDWYWRYRKDKQNNKNLFCSITGADSDNKRSRYTVVGNAKTGKIATAKRRADDNPNGKIGIGVAYARYCGVEIPVERKPVPLQTLKNGEYFVTVDSREKGFYIGKGVSENQHIWLCFFGKSFSSFRCACGDMLVYKE